MKWRYIALLFFLIPLLAYGYSANEAREIQAQALAEWNRHLELCDAYQNFGADVEGHGLHRVREALYCCQRALSLIESILHDIASKSRKSRKEQWCIELKGWCEKTRGVAINEIATLEKEVDHILSQMALQSASVPYEESLALAEQARKLYDKCPPRTLINSDDVVSHLSQVAALYRQAESLARKAYDILITAPFCDDKTTVKQAIKTYASTAASIEQEAKEWPEKAIERKYGLEQRLKTLTEDAGLFEEKGLSRSCYELQQQTIPILETLIQNSEGEEKQEFEKELERVKISVAHFEETADQNRLTEAPPPRSPEAFKLEEEVRRDLFFKSNLQHFLLQTHNTCRPYAIPLDGLARKEGSDFILYQDQFYRFLVQSDFSVRGLKVQVFKDGNVVHEETISLPITKSEAWQRYLITDGMVFVPKTALQQKFGIDLRLHFVCDPTSPFSMIIAASGAQSGLRISFSLDEASPLFTCGFALPPPWQLSSLLKPNSLKACKPFKGGASPQLSCTFNSDIPSPVETTSFPVLDTLARELKNDPLLLAQYVTQEIALADPFLIQEEGVFKAPGVHRNPLMTYLERRGSPWEQCWLLVYLLRKAGYEAYYVFGDPLSLPKDFAEKMLFTKLSEEKAEALVHYPWVLLSDGKKSIPLFPWMKEIQITEGYDLYNLLPEEYASADKWILRYLKGDENILRHIDSSGNDTAALLFSRFAGEELKKQGLSLTDVGIQRRQLKRQFSTWGEFPKPKIRGNHQIFNSIENIPNLAAFIYVDISSRENPHKCISCTFPAARVGCAGLPIEFTQTKNNHQRLEFQCIDSLDLDHTDKVIDVKVSYTIPVGSDGFYGIQTLSMAKGTKAALCFHFGGAAPHKTIEFQRQFSREKDEEKRLQALLAFMGAAYFDKCGYGEEFFANIHKIAPTTVFAFGLAKLAPDEGDVYLPQVDMFWFNTKPPSEVLPGAWNRHTPLSYWQYQALATVNSSSNEHQILRETFSDPYAISTVKLLQLAHIQHQKTGDKETGFLILTPERVDTLDKTPEIAQTAYFPHLNDVAIQNVKKASPSGWNAIKSLLDQNDPLSPWSYAYLTPGFISNENDCYSEMGALIFTPYTRYALISNNNLLFHGGFGTPQPSSYFTPESIRDWELTPIYTDGTSYYSLHGFSLYDLNAPPLVQETNRQISDIRPEKKSLVSHVADPVDTITGAFYIDEVDLALSGAFPLSIRRNYNSQNPILGMLGVGWKLSLNPYLIEQDGKRFAAEADGTVICYSYNSLTSRYEVDRNDNPDLYTFNQHGIGSTASLFHSYIKDDVLYGADGSKRFFEDGLLKKWINHRGDYFRFFYEDTHLSRIESSNGDYLGFHYNCQGTISEIYAKDGRRVSYTYDNQGNLCEVTLPNTATITYEYDRHHRILSETKPHGKVIENRYDTQGRVIEQKSPMGLAQAMVPTATFSYAEGMTTVTDACGGKTLYKTFDKQIYRVIDPLGNITLQSWFIDETSYFDAETEKITPWKGVGGFPRSLKSTTDKRGLKTSYLYDESGNPIEITLEGEDLTGSGETIITKKLAYNDANLCIQEEVQDQKTKISYDQQFPYLPKSIETYSDNILASFTRFSYDSSAQLVQENHNDSITLWSYDERGFPIRKVEKTKTDDPDVVTTYSYNIQGQCIQVTATDFSQENAYDSMGNLIQSEVFSPSGILLSAKYIGYNLNNQPIWKQTANPDNTLYLDYHASGAIKASRHQEKYTLYEYDPRGYLIEEVDPRGYCTTREYDALGAVTAETKEGIRAQFTYEAGGFVETIISPTSAQTKRRYTTNGLLKEEIYPDGTKTSITYDFFGRKIQETKNGITWDIIYDTAKKSVTRIHRESGLRETEEYDGTGNLLRYTDQVGNATEKTYDSLGRIKTETTPSGEQTTWKYLGNKILCRLANGETRETRVEAGRIVESKTFDDRGNLTFHAITSYDAETDIERVTQGDRITTTWMDAFGRPIKIQTGDLIETFEYDRCGNPITLRDGEGHAIHQTFDGLGRIIQKELPDGALLHFTYDLDSNLTRVGFPNGNTWQASYDTMGRKVSEKLLSGRKSTYEWRYTYEEGYLRQIKDPMGRIREYEYDPQGRLSEERANGWQRTYAYDPRGLLTQAEQIGAQGISWVSSWFTTPREEHSIVERSYDADGRLTYESIHLNAELIQESQQEWEPGVRHLSIGDHERTYTYQNDQLIEVASGRTCLTYAYDRGGGLISKATPLTGTTTHYNPAGLPEVVQLHLPTGDTQETLEWNLFGKLAAYASPSLQKQFTYTPRGYLQTAGTEAYQFDFGGAGIGIRTASPDWHIPQHGLDAFGRAIAEMTEKFSLATSYDAMGHITAQGQRELQWDPWGRLFKVTDPSFTWEASYDAFGRRLETRYTPTEGEVLTTTSLYDPEEEFQEIGVHSGDKTFWKMYGPDSCDAIIDETGCAAFLTHNALNELIAITTEEGTHYTPHICSSYGPQTEACTPSDLLSYARSLSWHSTSVDPTGLILMGKRYYDPKVGRFISPDPVGYPICMDLYAYAGGDPVNYFDPDGRFASSVYQASKPTIIAGLDHLIQSESFEVGSFDLPNGAIGFINGMANTKEESMAKARYLSGYAGGAKIYGVYNASNSVIGDLIDSGLGRIRIKTPPTQKIKDQWQNFFATSRPEAKFLQHCHSHGSTHLKNALLTSPEEVRQRIVVLAIAPAEIIPRKLCFQSYNYMSRRDFVTHFDVVGKMRHRDELIILDPHPDANFFDHDFLSPTFAPVIQYHINKFLENYGGVK